MTRLRRLPSRRNGRAMTEVVKGLATTERDADGHVVYRRAA